MEGWRGWDWSCSFPSLLFPNSAEWCMMSTWISLNSRTLSEIWGRRADAVMQDGRREPWVEPWDAKISLRAFRGSFAAHFAFPSEFPNPSAFKRAFKMQNVYPSSQLDLAPSTPGRVKKYNSRCWLCFAPAWAAPTYFSFFSQLFMGFLSLEPRVLSWL